MGGIIKAECECGYHTEFMGGSGKHNFKEVCFAPALCQSCHEIIVGNYIDDKLNCEKCNSEIVYYNNPQLQEGTELKSNVSPVKSEEIFILPSEKCLCPKCGRKEMAFKHVGCWG